HYHPADNAPIYTLRLHDALPICLTGNIASGKSTVVEFFRKRGATVIDADALGREAEAPGGAVLAAIARRPAPRPRGRERRRRSRDRKSTRLNSSHVASTSAGSSG